MAPSDDHDEDLSRWQLPLRPLDAPLDGAGAPAQANPVLPPITLSRDPHPRRREEPDVELAGSEDADGDEPFADLRPMQSPDITARFVVAQLAELNERLATLTESTTERATDALVEVHGELARLTSLREYDLTEQAAGIFAAVDAGAGALERFAVVVTEVTDDLRSILKDALASIGGTEGLAEAVVQGASDLAETRSEIMAAIGRIQRDLATLRRRVPVQSKAPPPTPTEAKLSDEQVAYVVEAVTEAVVAALNPVRPSRRKTREA